MPNVYINVLPVVHAVEGLFVGDVVHEDETHGAAVVSSRDCAVPLLTCCVLKMYQSKSS